MAVTTKTSFILASISSLLLFSLMQLGKSWLSSTNHHTLIGGLLGSFLFSFLLTVIGNLETLIFGKGYTVNLVPEVIGALVVAVTAASSVHRISGSSCFLLSLLTLFYINKESQKIYAQAAPIQSVPLVKKKKN